MKYVVSVYLIFGSYLCAISQVAFSFDEFKLKTKSIIEVLCTDSLQGRKAGTLGDTRTQQFLLKQLYQLKVKPIINNTYIQPLSYIYQNNTVKTANIVFEINNRATKYIIFVAHFDHLGYGGEKSRSYFKQTIHPGADDNASGVAMTMILAQWLDAKHQRKQWKNKANFIFAFVSGHEDGLFGSSHFVSSLPEHIKSNTKIAISLDMVGRLDKEAGLIIYDPAQVLHKSKISANTSSLKVTILNDEKVNDHNTLLKLNIAAVLMTTGIHDDYHTIYDTPEKINYEGMYETFCFLNSFLLNLVNPTKD